MGAVVAALAFVSAPRSRAAAWLFDPNRRIVSLLGGRLLRRHAAVVATGDSGETGARATPVLQNLSCKTQIICIDE